MNVNVQIMVSFVNNNPTSAQKPVSSIFGCVRLGWKRNGPIFFKFVLSILGKLLTTQDYSLLFPVETISYFPPRARRVISC